MGKKAFDKIAEGLGEVLAIARGEASPQSSTFPVSGAKAAEDQTDEEREEGIRLRSTSTRSSSAADRWLCSQDDFAPILASP